VSVNTVASDARAIEKYSRLQSRPLRDIRKQSNTVGEIAVMTAMVIFVIGGCWGVYEYTKEDEVETQKVAANPYEGLVKTLTETGINVKARMVQLYLNLEAVEKLNGWNATAIEMEGNNTVIALERNYGSWATLREQAKDLKFSLSMLGGDYQLSQKVPVNMVMAEATSVPINGTIAYLRDAMAHYWPEQMELQEKARVTNSKWKQVTVEIRCQGVYREDLDSLGSLVNGWPASFDSLKLALTPSGVLNGVITLQIVGS
jgi:hypothetical protein